MGEIVVNVRCYCTSKVSTHILRTVTSSEGTLADFPWESKGLLIEGGYEAVHEGVSVKTALLNPSLSTRNMLKERNES